MRQALPLLLLSTTALGQQYVPIATESFDYPAGSTLGDAAGGTGWLNAWWSGQNKDGAVVVSPGYDAVGNKLIQSVPAEGSYRLLDPAPHDDVTEGDLFGADGSQVWISFTSVQDPNGLDSYGGLSLFHQWVGEMLFLGSPYNEDRWGIEQTGQSGAVTDPNSSDTVLTRLVYRIDFLPGQEQVNMWLDPADPHPTTAPSLVHIVEDFRFNEIRLQSGDSEPAGFYWDDIAIEKQVPSGPIGQSYCGPANLNSTGQPAVISAFGDLDVTKNLCELTGSLLPQNQFGYFLASETQGFFLPPGSQGNLCLGGTIGRFISQVGNSGPSGVLQIDVDLANIPLFPPVAAAPGDTWNFQLWFRDNNPGPTSNFTDAVSVTFQ